MVRRKLNSTLDLGEEFYVWELATAVAGAVLGINAFDQPNVQESKDNTRRLLEEYKQKGALPEQQLAAENNGLKIYCEPETRDALGASALADFVIAHLKRSGCHLRSGCSSRQFGTLSRMLVLVGVPLGILLVVLVIVQNGPVGG